MTAEQEVIGDLAANAHRLVQSARETLELIGSLPDSEAAFLAMPVVERVATTAALKQFELQVLDDPQRWLEAVKLRNELVHEYPDKAAERLPWLHAAIALLPFLFETADRLNRVIATNDLLKGATP